MALVQCDQTVKSNEESTAEALVEPSIEDNKPTNDDLEDGEIEDDEDDDVPPPVAQQPNQSQQQQQPQLEQQQPSPLPPAAAASVDGSPRTQNDRDRRERDRRRHDDKKTKHMTEAEKSILHLRKRERMQREKWEKYRKETGIIDSPVVDDFASNIEKAIANVLKKKRNDNDDKIDDNNRGRKRKNRDRDRLDKDRKKSRNSSPKSEDLDENELLNIRGGSCDRDNKCDDIKIKDRDNRGDIINRDRSLSPQHSRSDYNSDSGTSSDRSKKSDDRRRDHRKNRRKNRDKKQQRRDRSRERRNNDDKRMEQQTNNVTKDSKMICVFFLQGKCQKNDCPYSHEAIPPMKLELCKFYLMECCAKGQNCSYMHSEFPCKFYHTGLQCKDGDNCKFAHGKPLSEGLKQILFKHIETAPREILGAGFPRLSREEALNMINTTQSQLVEKFGEIQEEKEAINLYDISCAIPPELSIQTNDNNKGKTRSRPSRWQDPEPSDTNKISDLALNFGIKPFYSTDQDMRINSNGDIDMRTLPPNLTPIPPILSQQQQQPPTSTLPLSQPALSLSQPTLSQPQPPLSSLSSNLQIPSTALSSSDKIDIESIKQDIDIRNQNVIPFNQDIDIRQAPITLDPRLLISKDIDIRQIPKFPDNNNKIIDNNDNNEQQKIDNIDNKTNDNLLANLPKTQRELFLRIQAQQKDNNPDNQQQNDFGINDNINWYSDDDDDDENRLTIKEEDKEFKENDEENNKKNIMSPPHVKPIEGVEKFGDLSKIDISAEVTKLLTSINTTGNKTNKDPRQQNDDNLQSTPVIRGDPRKSRTGSTETPKSPTTTTTKISIYEQGSIEMGDESKGDDVDLRTRSDVDLRNFQLPFKGMLNYTPAKEIDASINSHPPITWKVIIVDIPRPDYTGLKLNKEDAEKIGDPRLKKIFRLNIDDKDSPASPITSPKLNTIPIQRIDPRLKKQQQDDNNKQQQNDQINNNILTFNQQLTILQSSAFFQSLTSNQKLLLNQELSQRNLDHNGQANDPVLNSLLTNLNLIPTQSTTTTIQQQQQQQNNMGTALNILASINKLNPILNQIGPTTTTTTQHLLQQQQQQLPPQQQQNPQLLTQLPPGMVQPGLLGAAPGIPNISTDFPINFDPRNGGLLGNAPPPPFVAGYPPQQQQQQLPPGDNFNNFNDDYYQQGGGGGGGGGNEGGFHHNRDNRGFNRDRRRGRTRNHRNFRNRNNRANRSHSPP